MKIVTWNINSVRLRIRSIAELALSHNPDIICLQETKVIDSLFPAEGLSNIGYKYQAFAGEKSYNGVAILSKLPIENVFSLPIYNDSKRHIAATIMGIELHNFYVPAGGDEPDITINSKFKHKLEYIQLMQNWFAYNRSKEHQIILLGDLNTAPHEHDVWSSKQLRNVISHTDIERKLLLELQNSMNFIDSARHFTPMNEKIYTWWSYRNKDWRKSNRGRRLDHIWVSENLQDRMVRIESVKEARNWQQPSDHVPYLLEL